jgi:glutathione synthase/RimK-type ligase-like ATP-grasp enzyme
MSRGLVLVLTNERDLAADDVIRRLDAAGVEVWRLNAEAATSTPVPTWTTDSGSAATVGVIWWRQFETPARENMSLEDVDELLLARAQWRAWLATLSDITAAPWVNNLWAARQAENKVLQLRVATNLGFAVPKTVITNDPTEARVAFGDCDAVVKTIASAYFELSKVGFVYTHSLDDVVTVPGWFDQPMVVQQRLRGEDVRIIIVGEDCFGASCASEVLDWRTAEAAMSWEVWPVPGWLADRCRKYTAEMGLKYAAFDFIDTGDHVWFLEANQAGEWAFLDRTLNLGIADSLATMLAGLVSP